MRAVGINSDDGSVWVLKGLPLSMMGHVDEAERLARTGWDKPVYSEILIDAPPGGWVDVVAGETV